MNSCPMNLLCWEGYEAESVLGEFALSRNITTNAQTLLSDSAAAHAVLNGSPGYWDVLNINNAWVRDFLCHHQMIRTLDEARFGHTLAHLLPEFDRLSHWARDDNGNIIGVCQRFGAFNFVINTRKIDRASAEDQGFNLANDRTQRFGILTYDDFNVFHICLGAGINPFHQLDAAALELFSDTANNWFDRAVLVSDDHLALNRSLVSGGCIDGRGGIVFTEITSVLEHPQTSTNAVDFLEYITQPDIALRIAATANTLNPVAQMGDPAVFNKFTKQQLNAIQWDSLSADIKRCAMYRIPPNHADLHKRLKIARDKQRKV